MNAYAKGRRGENELAAELTRLLGVKCRRMASPYLPGIVAPDVYGLPGVHIEVKRRERVDIPAALRQAYRDAAPGEVALVAHRPNRSPWFLTVRLDHLPRLAAAITAIRPSLP